MADDVGGDWTPEQKAAIERIIKERVDRAASAHKVKVEEYTRQIADLSGEVGRLKPLAESADTVRKELEGIRTRAERDRAYPAALLDEANAPIRERIERLYDAEPAGEDGARPAFGDWLKADPLASRLLTLPAAPSGAPVHSPAAPPTPPARPAGIPSTAAGAVDPARPGPAPTPQQHKATHARLVAEGKIADAKAYSAEHMTPKAQA